MTYQTNQKKGDCEVCSRPDGLDTTLTLMHGNIWMCQTCREDEQKTVNTNAQNVVTYSRKIDAVIQLKPDVFVSEAVSFIQLQSAIDANADIPTSQKSYALLTEVDARMKILNAAIFEKKAELVAVENERNALLHNAQQVAAKLRESERAKFKQYDVNYQPKPASKPKPVSAGKKTFSKTELFDACKKYPGLDASLVRTVIVSRNMSAVDAAKYMAEKMGLV